MAIDAPACKTCGAVMAPVWCAQEGMRCAAWLCQGCGGWDSALGRERLITLASWETGANISDDDYRPLPVDNDKPDDLGAHHGSH